MSNNWIDEEQLALTSAGLKPFSQVNVGDQIWTRIGWQQVVRLDRGFLETKHLIVGGFFHLTASAETEIFETVRDPCTKSMFDIKSLKNFNNGSWTAILLGNGKFVGEQIQMRPIDYVRKMSGGKRYGPIGPNVKLPQTIDEELSWLLGNIYGDGCITVNNGIPSKISMASSWDWPQIEQQYTAIVKKHFNYECSISVARNGGRYNQVNIHSLHLVDWLVANGFNKSYSTDLVIPNKIVSAPPKLQMLFLSGFLDADGSVQHGRHKSIELNTTSFPFADLAQLIMCANGVKSIIVDDWSAGFGTVNNTWKLRVNGLISQARLHLAAKDLSIKLQNHRIADWDKTPTPYNRKSLNFHTAINRAIKISPHCGRYINLREFIAYSDYVGNLPFGEPTIQAETLAILPGPSTECVSITTDKGDFFWCNGLMVKSNDLKIS